jgi:predicted metal-binding membrane protein
MYEQCSGCCWAMFRLNAYGVYEPYWCELHSLRLPAALEVCYGAC